MKQRQTQVSAENENPDTRVSFRLDDQIARRFDRVVKASKRSKTSIVEECLQEALPKLERQYSKAA